MTKCEKCDTREASKGKTRCEICLRIAREATMKDRHRENQ